MTQELIKTKICSLKDNVPKTKLVAKKKIMTLVDHSPIKEHIGCLQYFSIVNKVAVNIFFNDIK